MLRSSWKASSSSLAERLRGRQVQPIGAMSANSSPPRRATNPLRRALQPARDLPQQFVADRVAEDVVDLLEAVEVDG